MTEKRLENIRQMEDILNKSGKFVSKANELLEQWKTLSVEIQQLDAYYQSPQWKKDYDASNQGQVPRDIPHGVLSEDAVYNLLGDYEQTIADFQEFIEKLSR